MDKPARLAPLRPDLAEILPKQMQELGTDERGYIVPWFVEWVDGKPLFQVADSSKYRQAVTDRLCWLSGKKLGTRMTFVAGPMCGINRISAEPPCIRDCAVFAAKTCPFLTTPHSVRREGAIKDMDVKSFGGDAIKRNPGVTLLWTTKSYRMQRVHNGVVVQMGPPEHIEFWARGRLATMDEIDESIRTGLPLLHAPATAQGPAAIRELKTMIKKFNNLLFQSFGERSFALSEVASGGDFA